VSARVLVCLVVCVVSSVPVASAGSVLFGDMDCLEQGCYGALDPRAGASLEGLADGVVTQATNVFGHGFGFSPVADFAGTDQIYVGSVQTGAHDGYSVFAGRINGPQVFVLDYSSLITGSQILSITLGIAADDFQAPSLGQPYIVLLNGGSAPALSGAINALDFGGPAVHFFSIGLDPALDNPSHTLTLSIDQGGDGGDGWAVDFLTVGITTNAPEPATEGVLGAGLVGLAWMWRRRMRG
jgi:MYXO-CTERM domain-containing protein